MAVVGITVGAVTSDRAAVRAQAADQARAVARMFLAYGEASLDDADKLLAGISDGVAKWDLQDPQRGRELYEQLRTLQRGSDRVSSAWVVDSHGTSVLDTWSFPPAPIAADHRSYFRQHVAGAEGPLIAPPESGSVTGRDRFTLSRAVREPDGSLHAILVVGVFGGQLNRVFGDSINLRGARGELYTVSDGRLIDLSADDSPSSSEFTDRLTRAMADQPTESLAVVGADAAGILAWERSRGMPQLVAAVFYPTGAIMDAWWSRTFWLAFLASICVLSFAGLAAYAARAAAAREAATAKDLMIKEVHHRVKNALQLLHGLVHFQIKSANDRKVVEALQSVAASVLAVAEVQSVLQARADHSAADLPDLIRQVCFHIEAASSKKVKFSSATAALGNGDRAADIAIISNELVTNAVKHATSSVWVRCGTKDDDFVLSVADDGPGFPNPFDVEMSDGFGLRMAKGLARHLNGRISAGRSDDLTTFTVHIPKVSLGIDGQEASAGKVAPMAAGRGPTKDLSTG